MRFLWVIRTIRYESTIKTQLKHFTFIWSSMGNYEDIIT